MRKGQIIQILLSYCDRQNKIPSLMAALEREKADPYHEEFGYIQHKKTNTSSTNYKSKQAFISHATKADSHFAHRLASDLEGSGWSVWIAPESIQPGEKWVESINRGLEVSRIFLLVLTPDAVVSRWVQSETNVAIEMEHEGLVEFIPLQVKACQVPPLWRAYQYVPFVKGYDFGWQLLLARLNSSLPSVHSSEQKHSYIKSESFIQHLIVQNDASHPIIHMPEEKKAVMGEKQVYLTPLENRILSYLMEHANKVCTTEELLENVWGAGRSRSAVEKGVSRLRIKIESDPARPRYILSAWGEGYLLRTTL
jgi:hypothetical protein